jgi:mono/diheme cytochrome c family protein
MFHVIRIKSLVIAGFLTIIILGMAQCNSSGELKSGKEIYQFYCVNCHGVDGRLAVNAALDLSRSHLPMEGRIEIIRNGRVTMMGFEGVLSEEQIDSVARYTLELQQ